MIRKITTLCAALLALLATPALAWGGFGHETTAKIALANVSPRTRAEITRLLRAEAALGTPYCRMRSLEEASTWADCLRRESWRWAYTFSWHYQTENICKPYDVKANCSGGNCVTAQIVRNRRILADTSLPSAQRLEALAWLTHFIGDLHMPLHSGDNADLGGNAVSAKYGIAPGRNLHSVWDGPMAERGITSAQPPLVRRYSAEERAELATGDVADWGRESWQFARDLVYARAFDRDPCAGGEAPKDVVWSNEDIEASLPTLRQRVTQAGLRLARDLDAALGGARQLAR